MVIKPQMSRHSLSGISPISEEEVTYLAIYLAQTSEVWRIFKDYCDGLMNKRFLRGFVSLIVYRVQK